MKKPEREVTLVAGQYYYRETRLHIGRRKRNRILSMEQLYLQRFQRSPELCCGAEAAHLFPDVTGPEEV